MELKAKLLEKYDTATFGTGGFRKREFVVEFAENPEYPEFVKFELIQDKCDDLDAYEIGAMITIAFNLKGRLWTNPKGEKVYFNALQAWRLSGGETAPNETGTAPAQQPDLLKDGEADDLPFVLTLLIASSFLIQSLPI